jgi:carbohydrate kinase (thermoresistant glucokinase family)
MSTSPKPLVVVMGVSSSGKSTVGELLAERLGVPYVDADDLHPQANVEKMAAGHPLNDDDRWPWLAKVGKALTDAEGTGLVIACSALKRAYRDAILAEEPRAVFIHLSGSHELLETRMEHREGHFMPVSLLDSQLETLEPLHPDEPGHVIGIDQTPEQIVSAAAAVLG